MAQLRSLCRHLPSLGSRYNVRHLQRHTHYHVTLLSNQLLSPVDYNTKRFYKVRLNSTNYAKNRKFRPPVKKETPRAGEAQSLIAQMLGDFSEVEAEVQKTLQSLEVLKEKHDNLAAQLEDADRLAHDAKAPTTVVKQNVNINYLEIQSQYLERQTQMNIESFADNLTQIKSEEIKPPTTEAIIEGTGEVVELLGTPDPSVPISDSPCMGCGAMLHCQDPAVPGYLASESFLAMTRNQFKSIECQRCKMLNLYNMALKVSVTPQQYVDVIKKIKGKPGLVLVVIDLTDMPNSLYRALPDLIGEKREVYIIGNKVDCIPKDSSEYLGRVLDCLNYYVYHVFAEKFHVRHTTLISAKTGYGVEDLVTVLLKDWAKSGPVYVVGCTNVGKSTLFNSLLSSDYCRSASRDLIQRATTSTWPGTT